MKYCWLLLMLLPCVAMAEMPDKLGIAAVVNDDIISSLDVDDRIQLVLGTTGLKDTPEIRARLRPQIVRTLIDESLQTQEANGNTITVTEDEVTQAITTLEAQRGKEPGSLLAFLAANGVPVDSFKKQLRTQIAWNKLVVRKLRSKVKVSNDEVDRLRAKLAATPVVSEVKIVTLLLPVDSPASDNSIKQLADKLATEIRGGASFEAVSNQFRGTATAPGEAFWVPLAQLDPLLAGAVVKIKPGEITDPVRTLSGYQIVKLVENKQTGQGPQSDAEVSLKQITLSLKSDAAPQEANLLLDIAKNIARAPGTCEEQGVAGFSNLEDADMQVEYVRQRVSTLSPTLRDLMNKMSVGGISEPFAMARGLQLIMLCERVDLPATLPDSDKVRGQIMQEKMELEAGKYMRNLRREAFVDIRP